jgi:hypothetical protein
MLKQRLRDCEAATDHYQRVTVSWGLLGRLHADATAGARSVFDEKLLAQMLAEILRDQPHGYVGNAAGAVGNNDTDWALRICARARGGGGYREAKTDDENCHPAKQPGEIEADCVQHHSFSSRAQMRRVSRLKIADNAL